VCFDVEFACGFAGFRHGCCRPGVVLGVCLVGRRLL
jgi:hypothetical protein